MRWRPTAYEMDCDSGYWGKLEEFFRLVSGERDILYGTNREILLWEDSTRVRPQSKNDTKEGSLYV